MDIHAFQLAGAALAVFGLGSVRVCRLIAHRSRRSQRAARRHAAMGGAEGHPMPTFSRGA